MSVRAYKLIKIITEEYPVFNLNETNITMLASSDEGGVMSFDKDTMEEEFERIDKELLSERDINAVRELEEEKITIGQIIKDCGDEEYVEYYCY